MKPLEALQQIKKIVNDVQYASKIPSIDSELDIIEKHLKMKQKCRNCKRFSVSVTYVWYDRLTGEQHRDRYDDYCCFKHITIDKNRINQYNKCPYYMEDLK